MKRAFALTVLTVVLIAQEAAAHSGGPQGYKSQIREVSPPLSGLRLRVLYGDDQIWLDNRSGKTVVIEGYGGEPYLRFGEAGVFVNVNSPAGYLNQDRYAQTKVPKSATPKAKPEWQKLAGGDVWAWHDHRIHYMLPTPPPKVRQKPLQSHRIFDWKVPARAEGKRFAISGSLDYQPPPQASSGDFPVGLVIVLAIVISAGMVGLFALRRVLLRSLE